MSKEATSYVRREVMTWPNAVTTVRLVCAIAMFGWSFLWSTNIVIIFVLALIGAVSDIVDGWIARTFHSGTKFGKHYDQYTDWLFGIAIIYTVFLVGGITFETWPFNGELCFLLGLYLLLRIRFLTAETIAIAKIKTLMQFSGGVAILGGHARVGELIGYGYVPEIITQESSALLINGGYLLVWSSIALMYRSLWNYWQNHKSARPT